MRTIKITTTRTCTRTAVVEIPCPESIDLEDVSDFLYDNEDLFREKMDNALSEAEEEFEFECDSTRYDVIEALTLTKKVYGGTL
jgi:predicted metal-dependent hydrolase